MNSKSIIKAMAFLEFAAVAIVVVVCVLAIVFGANTDGSYVATGAAVGAVIGAFIDVKILMPKKLKGKDERTMIVTILAMLFANGVSFVLTFVVFALMVYGAIELMNYKVFFLFVIAILAVYLVVDKISYKLLDKNV